MNAAPIEPLHIHVLAFAALRPGVSGGDKIFLECARVWHGMGHRVTFYGTEDGREMAARYGLGEVNFVLVRAAYWRRFGFAVHYVIKTAKAALLALRAQLESNERHLLYSAGDSPPDVLPGWILRRRYGAARWAAGFFLFAPTPWPSKRDMAYRGGRQPVSFRSIVYYLLQCVGYSIIRRWADYVVACNQIDVDRMKEDGFPPSRIWPIYGGVDLEAMARVPEPSDKVYDGCFVGRFHVQKGVLDLPRVWARVVAGRPNARLAVIGEGSLRSEMERMFDELHLSRNVDILGYLDGDEKVRVLKSSRVFLHMPILDTGGMAAAEAMGCGLPVVGFDLPGYRFSYPKGMKKVPIGDCEEFAAATLALLINETARQKLSREAVEFVREWAWPLRARSLERIFSSLFPKT